jgi:hypothetical protein
MQRYEETDRETLKAIGFDWRASPSVEHGPSTENPIQAPPTVTVVSTTGRPIALHEIHQYHVYEGALAGFPPDPELQLVAAMDAAKRHFPEFGNRPVMLEPVFRRGTASLNVHDEPMPWPWVKLPDVCSIAEFQSGPLARTGSDPYSSLVVIWFQDGYGMVLDARTLAQLRDVDWETHATGWSP